MSMMALGKIQNKQKTQQHAGDPSARDVLVGTIFAFLLALAVVALIYIAANERLEF
jgi:hypothetical protein